MTTDVNVIHAVQYILYKSKIESKLQDFVETTTNPFDQGQHMVGLGNKIKKKRYQR